MALAGARLMVALDRIPADRITAQAREIHFWRTVLTLVAGLLFGTGWLLAKAFTAGWFVLVWGFCAAREGWKSARPPRPQR